MDARDARDLAGHQHRHEPTRVQAVHADQLIRRQRPLHQHLAQARTLGVLRLLQLLLLFLLLLLLLLLLLFQPSVDARCPWRSPRNAALDGGRRVVGLSDATLIAPDATSQETQLYYQRKHQPREIPPAATHSKEKQGNSRKMKKKKKPGTTNQDRHFLQTAVTNYRQATSNTQNNTEPTYISGMTPSASDTVALE